MELSNKINLAVLRTQFGKTFMAINRIRKEIELDDQEGKSVHIVFTMNTLLNNRQFAKRLYEIERQYGKGSVVVFASSYVGPYTHAKKLNDILGLCYDDRTCPRIIIMCSNERRYEDGMQFLDILERNNRSIARAYVYYDELHAYISRNSLRRQIEVIHQFDIVKGIIALTATPDQIFQTIGFWSQLRMIHIDELNEANYAGYRDMIFHCIDDFFPQSYKRPGAFNYDALDTDTLGFIRHVLQSSPEILREGSRVFIPAHVRRSGHKTVRDIVFTLQPHAVVIVLNGEEKTLQYKDSSDKSPKSIPLEAVDEEVCETIVKVISQHKLEGRPLVYTGFLCVSMGQTLTHQKTGSFTAAILSHMDLTNDELYQLFGRTTGRMKTWPTYCQTEIYCPTKIMQRICTMEQCARTLVEDYSDEVVTQEDYRKPMMADEHGAAARENIRVKKEKKEPRAKVVRINPNAFRIFDDYDTMKAYCAILSYRVNEWKKEDIVDGFIKVGLNKIKDVASLKEAIKKVSSGYGGGQKQFRTYYPCYIDKTNVTTLRFVVLLRSPEQTPSAKIVEADNEYPSIRFEEWMIE
jgi:hypothetical protein